MQAEDRGRLDWAKDEKGREVFGSKPVWVIDDGGDERFTGMERTVQFDIEDNECGAFSISYLDVGNPNASISLSDPIEIP